MKGISKLTANQMVNYSSKVYIDDRWVLARPVGLTGFRYRLKLAWQVFTGKADVLYWTDQ